MGSAEIHRPFSKAKPPCWPEKVNDKSLKQAVSPCHPLFWGSNSQQSAEEQAQVKARRRDLMPLSKIFCSLKRGPAHSAFIKDVLEAAFQVHAALAQERFTRLALNGTRGAMKSFPHGAAGMFILREYPSTLEECFSKPG